MDDFIGGFEEGYFFLLVMMVWIIEEIGELVREINYYYGEKLKKISEFIKIVVEELGDCFFVFICMVNLFDIDMEKVYDMVMVKFKECDKDCWIKKEEKVKWE